MDAGKRIAVFGGTGMTGTCVVHSALCKDLQVRALVRDEKRLLEEYRSKVDVVIGDVLNEADVKKTLEGTSAVVVALGTRNSLETSTVMSNGLKNIVKCMKELNIKVISVCLSAFLFYPEDKVPAIFHNIDKDHRRMLAILQESDLDWIAVYPPHIADYPAREIIITRGTHPGPRTISKWNLGQFLVDAALTTDYYKTIVGLANVPE